MEEEVGSYQHHHMDNSFAVGPGPEPGLGNYSVENIVVGDDEEESSWEEELEEL
jgi:hypothetical protein